jgi:hypothetical protein
MERMPKAKFRVGFGTEPACHSREARVLETGRSIRMGPGVQNRPLA